MYKEEQDQGSTQFPVLTTVIIDVLDERITRYENNFGAP